MAELSNPNWSEIDAQNDAPAPDGWITGTMTPQQVEPTARSQMGGEKRAWDRINMTVTTTGASGTYSYATVNTSYPTSYVQGETFVAKLDKASAGADTFQVNALGTKPVYKLTYAGAQAIAAGDLVTGDSIAFIYDGALNSAAGGFIVRPSSQASASLIPDAIGGLGIANSSGTPNSIIDIGKGAASDSTNSIVIQSPATLSPNITASGALGLDTGAVAASTWYALIVISGSAGVSAMFTKETAGSAIVPTLPSGYTYYRYVGSAKTDGSSHLLAFKRVGNVFWWGAPVADVNTATVASYTLYTLSVPPSIKVQPIVRLMVQSTAPANTSNVVIASPDEPSTAQTTTFGALPGWDIYTSAALGPTVPPVLTTDTSGRIKMIANFTGAGNNWAVITRGWLDPNVSGNF